MGDGGNVRWWAEAHPTACCSTWIVSMVGSFAGSVGQDRAGGAAAPRWGAGPERQSCNAVRHCTLWLAEAHACYVLGTGGGMARGMKQRAWMENRGDTPRLSARSGNACADSGLRWRMTLRLSAPRFDWVFVAVSVETHYFGDGGLPIGPLCRIAGISIGPNIAV